MKNKLKLYISLILSVVFFSACSDFLDRKPLEATLDDLNTGGLEGQIYGLYSIFNQDGGMTIIPPMMMEFCRDDDSTIGSEVPNGGDGAPETLVVDKFAYSKDQWYTTTYWANNYIIITKANIAISTAETNNLTSDKDLKNIAEARFFRAWAYFNLVRAYGDVPILPVKVTRASDNNVPKSSAVEVNKLIQEDLIFATSQLPSDWGSKFQGRINANTANALLARQALWTKNYSLALSSSNAVIQSGNYELLPTYYKIFKAEGENSKENVWELQFNVITKGTDTYMNDWGTSQSIRNPGLNEWNLGWGWNVPTKSLVDQFESGDIRKPSTILVAGESDDPSTGGLGRTLPKSKSEGGPLWQKYMNKKFYRDPEESKAFGFNGRNFGYINKIMIRYADVLLMAAEGANETGDGATAAKYVNMIRKRAGLADIKFIDQASMRSAIKQERRSELALEGVRFYDLVRWGDDLTILGPQGYTTKHRLHPIPQTEIDKSGDVLKQNPDWE